MTHGSPPRGGGTSPARSGNTSDSPPAFPMQGVSGGREGHLQGCPVYRASGEPVWPHCVLGQSPHLVCRAGPHWAAQTLNEAQHIPCVVDANAPRLKKRQAGGEGAGQRQGRQGPRGNRGNSGQTRPSPAGPRAGTPGLGATGTRHPHLSSGTGPGRACGRPLFHTHVHVTLGAGRVWAPGAQGGWKVYAW